MEYLKVDLKNAKLPKVKLVNEFKTFAMKGNVVDMAVGIIIGAAFSKIVTSLVNDVIMPPIGLLVGGVNFADLKFVMKEAAGGAPAVTLNYGNFIQVIFDFVIVAFAIFLVIKAMAMARRKEESVPTATVPKSEPIPGKEELLLTEIRDLLRKSVDK